jgi:hypothetical protein
MHIWTRFLNISNEGSAGVKRDPQSFFLGKVKVMEDAIIPESD